MVFEIRGGSGNMVILIRCGFFPRVPSDFPQAHFRRIQSLVLRLWPFKRSSRQINC